MCLDVHINKAMLRGMQPVRAAAVVNGRTEDMGLFVDDLGWISASSQEGGEVDDARGFLFVDGHGLLP